MKRHLIKDQCSNHIETSPFICTADQLTSSFMTNLDVLDEFPA